LKSRRRSPTLGIALNFQNLHLVQINKRILSKNMFKQTWQSFKSTFQDGKPSISSLGTETTTLPPLTDADFEFLWMQLLEGVVNGWESHRIERFFYQLDERANKAQWLDWLGRYREKVTNTTVPDQILGRRLLLLQQQMRSLAKLRDIGTTAGAIGRQVLNARKKTPPVQHTPVWEYDGPDTPADQAQAVGAGMPNNMQAQTVSAEELAERLETDEALRQYLAQQLGVDQNSDPQTLIQTLLARSQENQPADPTDANGWFQKGLNAAQTGQWEEALRCWDHLLELEPDSQQGWYNRGGTLMMLQNYEDAIRNYDQSLERRPDDPEALFHRGICLNHLERYEEAIASYDQAILLKADYWHAWVHRGLAVEAASPTDNPIVSPLAEQHPSLQQHGYEGAVATYLEALRVINPTDHPEGWGRLHWVTGVAHAHQALKNDQESYWQEALSHYNEALKTLTSEAFPQAHLEILKNLIYAYQRIGETETASELQRKGAELAQKLQS
jgi:tetratricopeptide (TPR) repeat protein